MYLQFRFHKNVQFFYDYIIDLIKMKLVLKRIILSAPVKCITYSNVSSIKDCKIRLVAEQYIIPNFQNFV